MTYKRQMAKPWRAPDPGTCLLKKGAVHPSPTQGHRVKVPLPKPPPHPAPAPLKRLPGLGPSPRPCSARLSPFWVKTLMYSLFSKRSPRGYKNSQQAPVSLRSLTFFHWEFVYSQP